MSTMRISQLAKTCGVTASTLRFYESAGLLPAERTPAGYRTYGPDSVERLRFIGSAKHLGLSLDEIGELLSVWESGTCAQVKASMRPRITTQLAETESRTAELSAFAETLRDTLAYLDALPDRTERCDPTCAPPAARTPTPPSAALTQTPPPPVRTPSPPPSTPPIACTLTPEQIGDRLTQWREATAGAARHPINDGLRLTLPIERAATLTALAAAEQQCCPFFDFRLHLDGPAVHLDVRAPSDAAALLNDLFAA